MHYAIVEHGIVTNLIWLHPANAAEFPHAVAAENVPVWMGDSYENGVFFRQGQPVLSAEEETLRLIGELMGGVNDVLCE